MTLARYDELEQAGVPLLAQNHAVVRSRQARAQAARLREDAVALRNQAGLQLARSIALRDASGRFSGG